MALIKCPNCHKDVSSMVTNCPFCNRDLTRVKVFDTPNGGYYDPNHPASGQNPNRIPDSEDSFFEKDMQQDFRTEQAATAAYTRPANSQTDSTATVSENSAVSQRKRRKLAPPGRRLLGYRSGSFIHMMFSMCYYMAAAVGILYAFSLSSQYMEDGTLLFHICRVFLAALMLFLPALLLSDTKVRRKIPLFCSSKRPVVIIGLLFVYVPLMVLFVFSWRFCM